MRTTVLATQPKRHTIRIIDTDLAKKQTNHLMLKDLSISTYYQFQQHQMLPKFQNLPTEKLLILTFCK